MAKGVINPTFGACSRHIICTSGSAESVWEVSVVQWCSSSRVSNGKLPGMVDPEPDSESPSEAFWAQPPAEDSGEVRCEMLVVLVLSSVAYVQRTPYTSHLLHFGFLSSHYGSFIVSLLEYLTWIDGNEGEQPLLCASCIAYSHFGTFDDISGPASKRHQAWFTTSQQVIYPVGSYIYLCDRLLLPGGVIRFAVPLKKMKQPAMSNRARAMKQAVIQSVLL